MTSEWNNWSGSVRFRPSRVERPRNEDELCAAIRRAAEEGRQVRAVGALHSSSSIIRTNDVLVSLERLAGVVATDRESYKATVLPGTKIGDAGQALREAGLAMHTVGDIDSQTIAGAVSTGTHGTGRRFGNLATMCVGGRLVLADGSVRAFHVEDDPVFVRAVRSSLGTLGDFSELQLQLIPAPRLRRREWCCHIDDCMANLDELIEHNRNFDFYWYPRRDDVKLRTVNDDGSPDEQLPFATLLEEQVGWLDEVIAQDRQLKFEETEYAVPIEAGPACFMELRERIKARHRRIVGWRLLYRTVAADDAHLSTAHGRDTAMISAHHNAGLPFDEYFRDLEPIMRAHGGRPHWAKKHYLAAADLRPLYPQWDRFAAVRRELDPAGVFLSEAMRRLLEE
jgi:FAD/FMN-containing dehydrogenase